MSNEDNDRLRRLIKSEEETQGDFKPTHPTPPSTGGTTPRFTRPALDKDNMPLPRRVDEIDVEGTRVTRAAYEPVSRQIPQQTQFHTPANRPAQFKFPPSIGVEIKDVYCAA